MTEEAIITAIEKRMVNPQKTQNALNPYYAGYVDGLYDMGLIGPETRAKLYFAYADPELAEKLRIKLKSVD